MGVERYRSGEEMNAAPVATRAGDGFARFLRHCARWQRLAPRAFTPGVRKFRSVEEAQEARDSVPLGATRRSGAP